MCHVYNKETKVALKLDFQFLSDALFSSKEQSITECVIQVDDVIVESLNRHHAIWLNNHKLANLEPIASAFFKRLFYHFSNTYTSRKVRSTFKFEKDYEAICREWLGGLNAMPYKSLIQQQLGPHLDAVQSAGLIARYEIAPRVKGDGYKIAFFAGNGFFEDYEEFYVRSSRTVSHREARDTLNPQPLRLVAYFHQLLGHKQDTFGDKEKARAAELLQRFSSDEVRGLIDYAVEKMKATNHVPDFFGSVVSYAPAWQALQSERQEIAQRRAAANACPICQGRGVVLVRTVDGREVARQCNHGQTSSDGDT